MRLPLVVTILLIGLPLPATSQTWRELYDRGEHAMAAAVLHPLVLLPDPSRNSGLPDVEPTELLARLYWDGLGVQQDRIIGCSLAMLVSHSATFQHPEPNHPIVDRARRLQTHMCGSLSKEDRLEAGQMMGCPKFGPHPRTFLLDGELSVEISRSGIRINGAKTADYPLPAMCFERLALVRYTRVEPPADADLSPRHLIELFSWLPGPPASHPQLALTWKVLELVGDKVEWRDGREVGGQPGTTWVPADVPVEDTRVTFSMTIDGQIAWSFGAGATGLVPALPVVAPPDPPSMRPVPTTGTARVAVTVLDRFGSPLADAAVKLTGAVDREANTDAMGNGTLADLPDGRYDVVVVKKDLAPSAPRVLDVSGAGPVTLTVTLKPHGPNGMLSIACGGYDPRTLKTLAAGANLVVHVKIMDQATMERPLGGDDSRSTFVTSSQANVLQFYKTSPLVAAAQPAMTIEQAGGRIDRGEYIDFHHANHLPPLNVGDEYVLFLVVNQDGWWVGSRPIRTTRDAWRSRRFIGCLPFCVPRSTGARHSARPSSTSRRSIASACG
jgi:hypothetical protein